MQLDSVISRVLYTEEQIRRRVEELGKQITEEYKGKPLAVIGVLRGGSVFCSDLIRNIDIPMELSFIEASSYKAAGRGEHKFLQGLYRKGAQYTYCRRYNRYRPYA